MEGNGSMAIKVGINGFGRIGRVALRSMVERIIPQKRGNKKEADEA